MTASSAAHADVVTNFVRVTADTYKAYAEKGASWTTDSLEVQAIAKLTGAKADEVPALLKAYQFPTLAEERDLLSGPIVKSVAETSEFLKEQGKISGCSARLRALRDGEIRLRRARLELTSRRQARTARACFLRKIVDGPT